MLGIQKISSVEIPFTIILIPLVMVPLTAGCIACSWIVSSLSVYIRDTEQIIPLIISSSMFLSAVFYPIEAMPDKARVVLEWNPLARCIGLLRDFTINGNYPSIRWTIGSLIASLICLEVTYRIFKRAQRGFSEVI